MDSVRFDPENALTRDGGGRAEVEHPAEPEPVGPLAEKFLDQLAAQQADHRAEVFARLRRQKPAIRPNREKP